MKLSYGPPGHRGVSHLVAVGADEYADPASKRRVQTGVALAGGAFLLGMLSGRRTVRDMGAGAGLALLGLALAR